MNINSDSRKKNTYDAIVVGTGISGGWAAKELTEGGLKTLVLERGRDVKHVKDYPTMNKHSWELPYRDQLTANERKDYKVQLRPGYTLKQSTKHWWVKDTDQPSMKKKVHLIGLEVTTLAENPLCGVGMFTDGVKLTLKLMQKKV